MRDCIKCGTSFEAPSHRVGFCSDACRITHRRTYNIWYQMIQRCHNDSASRYDDYGARGITVCAGWRDFANFLSDMGYAPPELQLDRIDGDGDYCFGNCRWTTRAENQNNRRNTKRLTYRGVTQPLALWAAGAGLTPKQLNARLFAGWSVERAIEEPLHV